MSKYVDLYNFLFDSLSEVSKNILVPVDEISNELVELLLPNDRSDISPRRLFLTELEGWAWEGEGEFTDDDFTDEQKRILDLMAEEYSNNEITGFIYEH